MKILAFIVIVFMLYGCSSRSPQTHYEYASTTKNGADLIYKNEQHALPLSDSDLTKLNNEMKSSSKVQFEIHSIANDVQQIVDQPLTFVEKYFKNSSIVLAAFNQGSGADITQNGATGSYYSVSTTFDILYSTRAQLLDFTLFGKKNNILAWRTTSSFIASDISGEDDFTVDGSSYNDGYINENHQANGVYSQFNVFMHIGTQLEDTERANSSHYLRVGGSLGVGLMESTSSIYLTEGGVTQACYDANLNQDGAGVRQNCELATTVTHWYQPQLNYGGFVEYRYYYFYLDISANHFLFDTTIIRKTGMHGGLAYTF